MIKKTFEIFPGGQAFSAEYQIFFPAASKGQSRSEGKEKCRAHQSGPSHFSGFFPGGAEREQDILQKAFLRQGHKAKHKRQKGF